jgi:hypothetical protein
MVILFFRAGGMGHTRMGLSHFPASRRLFPGDVRLATDRRSHGRHGGSAKRRCPDLQTDSLARLRRGAVSVH